MRGLLKPSHGSGRAFGPREQDEMWAVCDTYH
jgi:hypothetical protein